MAQRIRLPFIVDVVLVSDPAEIRAVNEAQAIDRNFVRRGHQDASRYASSHLQAAVRHQHHH
jgi:hypothetical protein